MKEPKGVSAILEKIFSLQEAIKNSQVEIESLKGKLQEKNEKPEPKGFDYREAIMAIFGAKPANFTLNIDDVVESIHEKYGFIPDRVRISSRMNYLTDRDKKLERVAGKRGSYQLKVFG